MMTNQRHKGKKVQKYRVLSLQHQIKGERQLLDLKEAVDFISNKFDDFERDRLEKEKVIKDLKEEVTDLRGKVDDITAITDNDIDRTHRIGKPNNNGKPRPVIIKFFRYNYRKKIFV